MRSPLAQLLLLVGAMCAVDNAHAQADTASAQVLFDEARKAMARGDLASACPQLAESLRLDPAIGTLFNLAECYEKSGKTASAWSRYLEAADLARSAGQASREKTARGRATALEAKLSRMVVDVPQGVRVPGLTVSRDGMVIGEALWGVAAPVDPGEHTIVAKAPGRRDFSFKVLVATGTQTVAVPALVAEAAAPPVVAVPPPVPSAAPPVAPASPPPSGAPPRSEASATWQRPTSYALLGVGVVGIGVGTIFGFRAKSKNTDSLGQCRPDNSGACTSEGKSLRDTAKSSATIATIAFGVGAAAAIGGVVLFVTASSAQATAGVRIGPGSVSLEGRF